MLFCSNRKRRVCLFEGKWTNCGLPVNILFVVCFRETTQSNDANTELSIFFFPIFYGDTFYKSTFL